MMACSHILLLLVAALVCPSAFADDLDLGDVPEKVEFFLHTQENPDEPQTLILNNTESIQNSTFNNGRKTMLLVHGFMESSDFESIVNLRKAYVKNYDENVIVINYKIFKPSEGDVYIYYQRVGHVICALVRQLIEEFGLTPEDTYLIGHSVGVHVAGEAGKCLRSDGYLIRRITGLDPANWQNLGQSPMDVIRPKDAEIVDCIHTSTSFGIHQPICKCNFYPHGGAKQPECNNANEIGQLIGLCDHLSAFRYFQRTLGAPRYYPAYKCQTLEGNTLLDCSTVINSFMGIDQDQNCENGIYNV